VTNQAQSPLTHGVDEFCSGDAFARRLLAAEPERVCLSQGETLFEQGDRGDSMYLLLQGRLCVRLRHADGSEMVLAELEAGAIVGEMALLTGQARTATVSALADAELVRCSKESFERLAAAYPEELGGFLEAITHRLRELQLGSALKQLFGEIDAAALHELEANLAWRRLVQGEVLFRQGDPGETMYIVVSGRLQVFVTLADGSERVLGEVAAAETVGEWGLLTGEAHSATVRAIRETHVVELTEGDFLRLIDRYPQAMMRITRIVVRRQQRMLRAQPVERARALSLALIPAGEGVPVAGLAQQLADSLVPFGPVLQLDRARLDRMYGKEGAAEAACDDLTSLVLAAWLTEQETRYRHILYVADSTWSAWTERCVRQADRLLIVGQGHRSPTPGPVERAIRSLGITTRTELVLLHGEDVVQPSGTSLWLAPRQVHTHHHVRMGERAHYERLARRLSGRAVGLVLCGCAARGFSYVGVFRALEELGIPVDLIAGTSMGSLMGGMYATGRDFADIAKLAERFADPKRIFDYTLPFVSLTSSRKLTDLLRELFLDLQIEDLWRPFFCISTNMTRAEPFIHQTGPMWEAIRASCAIPGLFTPILRDGDVLIDGATINNFPVDIMCEMFEVGTMIGALIPEYPERAKRYEFGPSISGWQVLWRRVNPFVARLRVPSVTESLVRAMHIAHLYHISSAQSLVDVLVQPDVSGFESLDFASSRQIIEIGYQAARQQLAAWLEQRQGEPVIWGRQGRDP
jgi:predicted acylesterase/phospholipase RssA/CRP-like cAMP-binding protein